MKSTIARSPLGLASALGLALTCAHAGPAQSESTVDFEFSNLLEYQIGRDPTAEPGDRTRFFDQFVLDAYVPGGVRLGLRFERFDDSPPPSLFGGPIDEYEYDTLAQRFVEWTDGRTSLRLGNGYAILGHGLVFRAFELPGVVRQTRFPLVSYAESRDLDGVVLHSWRGPLEVQVLHGSPVVRPDVAPEQMLQMRRSGTVSGGRAVLSLHEGLRVGGSYLRADGLEPGRPDSNVEEVGAVELGIEPLRWFDRLTELAPHWLWIGSTVEYAGLQWQPWDDGLTTTTGTPHALYTHTQIGWSGGALSIETKDYHQFLLRVNDPPSLVPEFTHRLLNRTTHVLEPQDEKGQQWTLSQALPAWLGAGSIEFVRARATGRPETVGGYGEARVYEQTFVALESDARRAARARLYFSDGRDQFEALDEIRTVGLFGALALPEELAVEIDVGHQVRKRRDFVGNVRSDDLSVQATLSRASLGQIGVLWERTDDPLFLDDPFSEEIEDEPRHFLMGSVAWVIDQRHDVVVSYGERRGGTACTSGTCYFVPDFEGLELRVRSRF